MTRGPRLLVGRLSSVGAVVTNASVGFLDWPDAMPLGNSLALTPARRDVPSACSLSPCRRRPWNGRSPTGDLPNRLRLWTKTIRAQSVVTPTPSGRPPTQICAFVALPWGATTAGTCSISPRNRVVDQSLLNSHVNRPEALSRAIRLPTSIPARSALVRVPTQIPNNDTSHVGCSTA